VDSVKAEELLWLYKHGERNFRCQQLNGESFRGQDLSGIDLSGADIRGVDFTNATLRGVNFSNVKAGLPLYQAVVLCLLFLSCAALLGALTGFVGALIELQFRPNSFEEVTAEWVALIFLIGFATLSLRNSMAAGFTIFLVAFVISQGVAFTAPAAVPVGAAIAITITVTFFVAVTTAAAVLLAMAALLAFNKLAAIAVSSIFFVAFALDTAWNDGGSFVTTVVIITMLLGTYMGWRALEGDGRHRTIRSMASAVANRWGTSFRGADLTNADFSKAMLKSTNFNGAILTRARWNGRRGAGMETA
jgi:Pentapeptide repeats (8 copies)